MKTTFKNALLVIVRLIIGVVLVYAGFSKAVAPTAEFAAALSNYHLFPSTLLMPLAFGLPWIEIWTGLLLIAGLYMPVASAVSVGLFLSFLGVLSSARLRHIDLASCGCFGAETFSPQVTFRMDIGLLFIAVVLFCFSQRPQKWTLDATFNR